MGHSCSSLQQLACKQTKMLATHRSQVARSVARPLASTSSSRDEIDRRFCGRRPPRSYCRPNWLPGGASRSSSVAFYVLLQPALFSTVLTFVLSSSSMLFCGRAALPACVGLRLSRRAHSSASSSGGLRRCSLSRGPLTYGRACVTGAQRSSAFSGLAA